MKFYAFVAASLCVALLIGCGAKPLASPPGNGSQPAASTSPSALPVQPPPPAPIAWIDASKTGVFSDDVWVSIVETNIGKVTGNELGEKFTSEKEYLKVYVRIDNVSKTRKLDYKTWAATNDVFAIAGATLKDNFNNSYNAARFAFGTEVAGQLTSEAIHPGKTAKDVLIFERPIENAQTLFLELPPKNIGTTADTLKFQIPMRIVTKK